MDEVRRRWGEVRRSEEEEWGGMRRGFGLENFIYAYYHSYEYAINSKQLLMCQSNSVE